MASFARANSSGEIPFNLQNKLDINVNEIFSKKIILWHSQDLTTKYSSKKLLLTN
jgi:hypothetical protein